MRIGRLEIRVLPWHLWPGVWHRARWCSRSACRQIIKWRYVDVWEDRLMSRWLTLGFVMIGAHEEDDDG